MTGHDPRRIGPPPPSMPPLQGLPPTAGDQRREDEASLLAQLRSMLADLNGYTERRAAELAEPRIATACEQAAADVETARTEAQTAQARIADLTGVVEVHQQWTDWMQRQLEASDAYLRELQSAARDMLAELQHEHHPSEPRIRSRWVDDDKIHAWQQLTSKTIPVQPFAKPAAKTPEENP